MTAEETAEMERLRVMVGHLHTHLHLTHAKLDAARRKHDLAGRANEHAVAGSSYNNENPLHSPAGQ